MKENFGGCHCGENEGSRRSAGDIVGSDEKRNLEKIESLIKVMDLPSVRVLIKD